MVDYETFCRIRDHLVRQQLTVAQTARALGLDTGPMTGFDAAGVDAEFFANDPERANWKSDILINLGIGTTKNLFPRLPRLAFEEAAAIL